MELKIGMIMKNLLGEEREITKISPTGLCITTKNLITKEKESFRFYESSGKYISRNNSQLGDNWRSRES